MTDNEYVGLFSNSKASPVPICTTLAEQEARYAVQDRNTPEDEYDNHMFTSQVSVHHHDRAILDNLISEHLPKAAGGRQGVYRKQFEWHLEQLLLNLGRAILCHRWLLVPEHNSHYKGSESWLRAQGFQYKACKDLLSYFAETGLVEYKQGKKFEKGSMVSRIYPSKELAGDLAVLALYTQQPFTGSYVEFTDKASSYNNLDLSDDHPDMVAMNTINEYLKSHTWPLKGPLRLKYTSSATEGGRVYTAFQGLPSRSYEVRQNMLLDGEPIIEIDFSANHIRLCLAVMAGLDAGDDPYSAIAELAGQNITRDQVKKFITVAMGASSREKVFGAALKAKLNPKLIPHIESATLELFPDVTLYTGFGVQAQSLEGQILIKAMLAGVEADLPMLPLHDAVVVRQRDAEVAEKAMFDAWCEVVGRSGVEPRLTSKL